MSDGDNDISAVQRLRAFCVATRTDRGWSQKQVAIRGGIPPGTISNLEGHSRNSLPSQKTLEGLAKGLGVPYEQLDRIVRGRPADLSSSDIAISNLMSDITQDQRRSLVDLLMLTPPHRVVAFAALAGVLSALRTPDV